MDIISYILGRVAGSGGGDDWSDIGYSSTPQAIDDIHAYSKQIYDNWDADNPHTFRGDTNLVICPLIDTSKMTNMKDMFRACSSLREVPTLNTSGVTNMSYMFQSCSSLKEVPTLNTSVVTNMGSMFDGCRFKEITCDFATSEVSDFAKMFLNCSGLTTINFGNNFTFEKAKGMFAMFSGNNKLDNETLNQILYLCTTTTSAYTEAKTLARIGITSSFINYANIPNLSNYQAFLDAGWTIS